MDEHKITDFFVDISTKLGAIQQNLKDMTETMLKHESRLSILEQNFNKHLIEVSGQGSNTKDEIIKMLVKCLSIGLTVIASLTGSGALLKAILGL